MQEKEKYNNMGQLHGWVFTFNIYTKNWVAATRDQYLDLFSKPETEFLRSKNINTLQELIIKTGGDEEKIKKLIK
jgi:hypothetical protein